MALVVLSIDRDELPPHTDEQFAEWVKFQVGHSCNIEMDNPIREEPIDAYVREIG